MDFVKVAYSSIVKKICDFQVMAPLCSAYVLCWFVVSKAFLFI